MIELQHTQTLTDTERLTMALADMEQELEMCKRALAIRDDQLREMDEEVGALKRIEQSMLIDIQRLGERVKILAMGCASRKRAARELALAEACAR